jgi:hypothetical protein
MRITYIFAGVLRSMRTMTPSSPVFQNAKQVSIAVLRMLMSALGRNIERSKEGYDGRGACHFFRSGVHQIMDPYYAVSKGPINLPQKTILNGDRTIVTVDQGVIGYCLERGQPCCSLLVCISGSPPFSSLCSSLISTSPSLRSAPWYVSRKICTC